MNILVRAPNWIGDAVMATPALSLLRSGFPEAEITLLAKPHIAELLRTPLALDRQWVYERPGPHEGGLGLWRLIRSLRLARFDWAVLLQNAFEAALIAVAAGIPKRIGYAMHGRGWLLTHTPKGHPHHQREAYLRVVTDMIAAVSMADPLPQEVPAPSLHLTEQERTWAEQRLAEESISQKDYIVGICPGAAYGSAKQWGKVRFAQVASALISRYHARILIFGSRSEMPLSQQMHDLIQGNAVMLAGETTVRQMMALIACCRLVVSNDSGLMHVASALGIPVVAIFGPTDPQATGPAGLHCRIVHHPVACAPCTYRICPIDHRCMEGISTQQVIDAIEAAASSAP